MTTGNRAHLLKLADREYHHLTGKPPTRAASTPRHFKAIRMSPEKYDSRWDRKRGAAVRLTAVLLREDDATLQERVCATERSVKDYTAAADWLQRESAYLRKVARLLDTGGGRVVTVLGRCKATAAAAL